ncbi:MAG TPA: kelch repeat-containing protein [Thermoanaerobaculia bacterium]|nr:kelch repeat-containing protein [Thermoanaerobaculia bacterium]
MTHPSLKKALLFCAVALAAAPSLLAKNPSARSYSRMAFDARSEQVLLFGGSTMIDAGTRKSYDLNDTWTWDGQRWIQLYPATVPTGRSIHVMVYDSNHSRVLMFGGRNGRDILNDTWAFQNGDWRRLDTPASPPGRTHAGAAFDSVRDRVVLYGGFTISADGKTTTTFTDTWEFDGTTWTQVVQEGPKVTYPRLAYDAARNQTIMVGMNDKNETVTYVYDAGARSWKAIETAAKPACAFDGAATYQPHNNTVVFLEGICASPGPTTEAWEWDGSNWAKVETTVKPDRLTGAAITYDAARATTLTFGGNSIFGSTISTLWARGAGEWAALLDRTTPMPRSLFTFEADPIRQTIWMFGGITDSSSALQDLWRLQNGQWLRVDALNAPTSCAVAASTFDTDRGKLVVFCVDANVYEWDGSAWTKSGDLRTKPVTRRFASMTYDRALKKTVLFGGYDDVNYRDDTWLWNGTEWTEVKKDRAPSRSLAAMWFDPVLNKTVVYGGIGRRDKEGRIERYSDMWSFDGNGWTEIKVTTPGSRYGAQVVVDPKTNRTLLFGGMIVETAEVTQSQAYAGDFWEWNGTAWTKRDIAGLPPARENGAMEFDPVTGDLVVYGGWAGHFLSDVWTFNGQTWQVRSDGPMPRRRPVLRGF